MKIKGKEYVTVNERVTEFRTNLKYDGWRMIDEIIDYSDTFILIKTTIYDANGIAISTGIAQEFRDASNINKTSYIENCETSAWGRALGNLGIGISSSIASAEETENAINRQENLNNKVDTNAVDALKLKAAEKGVELDTIKSAYKVDDIHDLTVEQWTNAMRRLDASGNNR